MRTHRVLYTAALVVVAVAIGGTSSLYFMARSVNSRITTVDVDEQIGNVPVVRAPTIEANDPIDPFSGRAVNIAVFGSDSRGGSNSEVASDGVEGVRADVAMIVHVSAARDRIDVVSIPRDTTVTIPPCEYSNGEVTGLPWTTKFNAAFARGGERGSMGDAAACAIKTIHQVTNIRIDEFAVVDFTGFITMVDALGGVEMCIPNDMSSTNARLNLKEGCQRLDGKKALAYSRARTGVGLGDGSDINRISRQHEMLRAIVTEVNSKNLLTSGPDLYQFLLAFADALTVSKGLGRVQEILGFAQALRSIAPDHVTVITAPFEYDRENRANVVLTSEAAKVFDAIAEDRPIPGSEMAKKARQSASQASDIEVDATKESRPPG